MKTKARTKRFDCVAMKRAAQRKIRARVRGMTPAQEIAFFRAGGSKFAVAIAAAKRAARRRRHSLKHAGAPKSQP
jgi:hypothetical protein